MILLGIRNYHSPPSIEEGREKIYDDLSMKI